MTSPTADREILISRLLNAPRALAWQAMTDPRHIVQWWGPNGFTTTVDQMDVRPGGAWTYVMHGPDGTDYPTHCVFQEVIYPERLVFTHGGAEEGGPEVTFIGTWTFETVGEQTRVTIHMVFPTAAERDTVVREYGAIEGGKQTLERLATHLSEMGFDARAVILDRIVAASPALVFQCWTVPAHMIRWWGPKDFTNTVCELDVKVGGAWRIVMRAPDGTEYPCHGVYQEVVPNERLVFTNNATGQDGNPVLDGLTTVTFTENNGQTRLVIHTMGIALVPFAVNYLQGMEAGWIQSLDRLDTEVTASIPV